METNDVIQLIPRTDKSPIVIINDDKSYWYGRFGMIVATQQQRICVEIPVEDNRSFVWFMSNVAIGIDQYFQQEGFERVIDDLDDIFSEERKECPDHCSTCDRDGFCNICGEQ